MFFKEIEENEYINLKNFAYNLVPFFQQLPIEFKYKFISSLAILGKNKFYIFINTLLLPNDIELTKTFEQNHNVNEIAKKYKLPLNLVLAKLYELKEKNIIQLIIDGKIKKEYAMQQTVKLTEEISIYDLIRTIFQNDASSYVEKREQQVNDIQNDIMQFISKI